mgnify:CR=1 FL=1
MGLRSELMRVVNEISFSLIHYPSKIDVSQFSQDLIDR